MSQPHSISQWLHSLKAGETAHVQELWDRYRAKLVEIAGRRLAGRSKVVADEDDVVQSVFISLCRGAVEGRFNDVNNRDELWWLLLAITKQKAVSLIRRSDAAKRGGRRVFTEADYGGTDTNGSRGRFSFDQLVGQCPTPETITILEEECQRLFHLLPNTDLINIAKHRLEGYSVPEIAVILAISKRSVERKLGLIRNAWAEELICAV